MPASLSSIQQDKRKIIVKYGDNEVNITYKPSEWTPASEDALRDSDTSDEYLGLICRLVLDWDLLEDDDSTVPLTVERLRTIPSAFLTEMSTQIWDDMTPGEVQRPSNRASRRRG